MKKILNEWRKYLAKNESLLFEGIGDICRDKNQVRHEVRFLKERGVVNFYDYINELPLESSALSPTSNEEELKRVFRKIMIKFHPDRNPDNEEVLEKFKTFALIFDILLNPECRGYYDEILRDESQPGPSQPMSPPWREPPTQQRSYHSTQRGFDPGPRQPQSTQQAPKGQEEWADEVWTPEGWVQKTPKYDPFAGKAFNYETQEWYDPNDPSWRPPRQG